MSEATKAINAFFYGTLMHPNILTRVIGNDGSHLEMCPAILKEYTRHKVKGEEYPGLVPFSQSHDKLFGGRNDLSEEDICVRGTLVAGLTIRDIQLLDFFEGTEYTRNPVKVHPLGPLKSIRSYSAEFRKLFPPQPPPLSDESNLAGSATTDADTYVFIELEKLEESTWDFSEFVEQNAWKWYGVAGDRNEYVVEVDRRRERGEREMQ